MTHGLPIQAGLILLNGSTIEKRFPCSNDLAENIFSHSDCKPHFYIDAWFVSENVPTNVSRSVWWNIVKSEISRPQYAFSRGSYFSKLQSFQGPRLMAEEVSDVLSRLRSAIWGLLCFLAFLLPCICNNGGTSLGGASVNLPGKDMISKSDDQIGRRIV